MPEEEKKKSFFQKIKTFLLHPTVWRTLAVASAAVAAGLSGGAAIPVAMLCLVFVTSFISIIGKTLQLRSLEKSFLQGSLVKKIADIKAKTKSLAKTKEHERVLGLIKKEGPINKVNKLEFPTPTYRRSFLKTLRNVGLENTISVASLLSGNPAGLLGYIIASVLAVKNIKKEFDERVKTDLKTAELKKKINDTCAKHEIPKYTTTLGLHDHFKNEMIEHEAKKRLLAMDTSSMTDDQIKDRYARLESEISGRIEFETLPVSESLFRQFVNTINPFNKNPVKSVEKFQEAEFDRLTSYKEPTTPKAELVVDPPRPTPPKALTTGKNRDIG